MKIDKRAKIAHARIYNIKIFKILDIYFLEF